MGMAWNGSGALRIPPAHNDIVVLAMFAWTYIWTDDDDALAGAGAHLLDCVARDR
jgi:hypothetical protein